MAAYIKEITQGGNTIYPRTTSQAVMHEANGNQTTLATLIEQKAPLHNPEFTGAATVAAGSDYTVGKLRNIYFSTTAPTANQGENGDIWIVYTA